MSTAFVPVNFRYDPDIVYFFYIGELKGHGLTYFIEQVLSARLNTTVQCLAIIPDLLEQYNFTNLLVFDPDGFFNQQTNTLCRETCRRKTSVFLNAVSTDSLIQNTIEDILSHQDELYIYMFESHPEMTLDTRERVILLGPDKVISKRFNNKAVQFQAVSKLIPVVDFQICETFQELLKVTNELRPLWADGIFVSRVYSAAGAASLVSHSQNEINNTFSTSDAPFLITRYIPHELDPTVLAVVANEDDVYIAGVADQKIEGGNRFVGSTWPSILEKDLIETLTENTREVGRMLGRSGFRGIFGCDYIVTNDNEIRFIEINARKQGTTLEFCYALEQILPPGSPSLPELEYYAVLTNTFPDHTREVPPDFQALFCWGTHNYKLKNDCCTTAFIPQDRHERESFKRVSNGKLSKDYLILDHVGSGLMVKKGTFLSRIVSVGKNIHEVEQGLTIGKRIISMTLDKNARQISTDQ